MVVVQISMSQLTVLGDFLWPNQIGLESIGFESSLGHLRKPAIPWHTVAIDLSFRWVHSLKHHLI